MLMGYIFSSVNTVILDYKWWILQNGIYWAKLILLKFSLADLRRCPWGQLWAASSSFKATKWNEGWSVLLLTGTTLPSSCDLPSVSCFSLGRCWRGRIPAWGRRGVLGRSLLCPGSAEWIPLKEREESVSMTIQSWSAKPASRGAWQC